MHSGVRRIAVTVGAGLGCVVAFCSFALAAGADGPGPADAEFFENKIRPLLVNRCHECHSAGAKKLKGSLRLDSREGVLKGGETGPAIVPGDPAKSRLIEAVGYQNADLEMPPKDRLSKEEVADLTEWVKRGAPWGATDAAPAAAPAPGAAFDLWGRRDSHWAWQPVRPHEPPAVNDAGWARGPIDRFIFASLQQNGLSPAAPADRRTLIRRAYFTLTGLPPTPEEAEAFVGDTSPDALEKVVDRLLASPHFGERWARHWMDLVRYSDTLGNEADMPVHNGWRYRDYLIRAFNADLPYDQLVTEHVAGDLLPKPRLHPQDKTNESVIGTGFFWMNEGKRSPVDLRLAQAEAFDNRIDVLCKTFLGLTVACARCHDHKFDAIPTADYYALYGYLKSSRYTQALLNAEEVNAKARELSALRTKVRRLAAAAMAERASTLSEYLKATLSMRRSDRSAAAVAAEAGLDAGLVERWSAALEEPAAGESHPLVPWLRAAGAAGAEGTRKGDAPRAADVAIADFGRRGYEGWFVEDQAFGPSPLRPGDFLLGAGASRPIATFVRGGAWAHSGYLSRKLQGTLRSPSFDIDRRFLHVYAAGKASRVNVVIEQFVMIQDPLYGSLRKIVNDDGPRWLTWDLSLWKGRQAYLEFADTTTQDLHDMRPPDGCGPEGYLAAGRVVLSDEREPPPATPEAATGALFGKHAPESPEVLAAHYQRIVTDSLEAFRTGKLSDLPDAEARASLLAWLTEHGLLDSKPTAELVSVFKQIKEIESRLPEPQRAPAMTEGTPEDGRVYVRGDPKHLGPAQPRRILQAISGEKQSPAPSTGSGRLQLARLIADPANPLTSRVMVNRVWHHVFGRGIVASVDNFGALGEQPSHPELLDHLAERFVKEGWSVKKLVRELVLSSTFRMDSRSSPEVDAADPDNRLLHRMPVRRLEAEAIRDQVLAVSGRLDRDKMFGPGVEVYLTPFMENGYASDYGRPKSSGPMDGDGRRGIYLIVRRNFLNPMLVAFDTPPPLNTAGRRVTSNVPAQALILMNDPFVAEQAKLWAKRVLAREGLDWERRVRRMYAEALARPPTEQELAVALRFLDSHGDESQVPPEKRASDERLWADLAHVLMNVKEFIYLN